MRKLMVKLWKDEEGQGMVEYGLIIALVSVASIVALNKLGILVAKVFMDVVSALS